MSSPVQFAPWEEAARQKGITGRDLEDSYFAMLKERRTPLLQSMKEAFIGLMKELNQGRGQSDVRLEIGPDTNEGFSISSVHGSGAPKRQVWLTLSGTTEILASRRDSKEGDCGAISYHASGWDDFELVGSDSEERRLNKVVESHCRWMLAGD